MPGVAPLRRPGLRRDRHRTRRLVAAALGDARLAFGGERLRLHFLLPVTALVDLLGRPRHLLGSALLLQLVMPRPRARVGLLPRLFFRFALRLGFLAPRHLLGSALLLQLVMPRPRARRPPAAPFLPLRASPWLPRAAPSLRLPAWPSLRLPASPSRRPRAWPSLRPRAWLSLPPRASPGRR